MKDIDWSVFWTAVGSIVATLTLLGGVALWLFSSIKKRATKDLENLRDENTRLRQDIDAKLKVPSFSLDAIKLTEVAAEKRIAEIEEKYNQAIGSKDQASADHLSRQLAQIEKLKKQVESADNEREQLRLKLQTALIPKAPQVAENAVGLLTGKILVIRKDSKYGAVLAVDQSSDKRGSFIKYAWWYQPDGSGQFLSPSTISGFGEAKESYPGSAPILNVGPIAVEWSIGGDGQGWVYFHGPFSSSGCALAPTSEVDISKINAEVLHFHGDAA